MASKDLKRIERIIEAAINNGVKYLLHIGRVLEKEHLGLLKKFQDKISLSLIDNGSAVRLLPQIKKLGLFFNEGIDISVDGIKANHEKQRGKGSWQLVLNSYQLKSIAKGISFIGATSVLNYKTIVKDFYLSSRKFAWVDKFVISTIYQPHHRKKRVALNNKEMRYFFKEALKYSNKFPLTINIFTLKNIIPILDLLPKEKLKTKYISLHWKITQLEVGYFPASITPNEEFPIDCNGRHFIPFGGDYHVNSRPEKFELRDDLIVKDPDKSYQKIVGKFRRYFGEKFLEEEKKVFGLHFRGI